MDFVKTQTLIPKKDYSVEKVNLKNIKSTQKNQNSENLINSAKSNKSLYDQLKENKMAQLELLKEKSSNSTQRAYNEEEMEFLREHNLMQMEIQNRNENLEEKDKQKFYELQRKRPLNSEKTANFDKTLKNFDKKAKKLKFSQKSFLTNIAASLKNTPLQKKPNENEKNKNFIAQNPSKISLVNYSSDSSNDESNFEIIKETKKRQKTQKNDKNAKNDKKTQKNNKKRKKTQKNNKKTKIEK